MDDQIQAAFQLVCPVPQAYLGTLWEDSVTSGPTQDRVKRLFLLMMMAIVGKSGGTISPVCLLSYLLPRQASRKGRIGERGRGKGERKGKGRERERKRVGRSRERPQGK